VNKGAALEFSRLSKPVRSYAGVFAATKHSVRM
jgi:hypothetical protein